MKGNGKKSRLTGVNRTLTGILAASIVMSNLSGTGLVVYAAEEVQEEKHMVPETEESSSEDESIIEESVSSEITDSEEASSDIEEESSIEELISQETIAVEMQTEELTAEMQTEDVTEEISSEEITLEDITGEESLFASVYLEFNANGGNCEVSLMELTPDNMEMALPQAQKAGFRFTGWYMDAECTIAFDESNIFWEAGGTYVLYAGYEQVILDEVSLIERTLQQSINGVTITVEGNMPAEVALEVRVEELTQKEQENIVRESNIVDSTDALNAEENSSYSYDITIRYQDVEYEPYLFDEMMQVTFSFVDEQELQDAGQMEVFHIDDYENVEKIEIKEVTESEVSFEADAFSTYILITKVEYTGNKNWNYDFTGDVQTFTAPVSGQYIFECYGAGTDKSKGSFAKGTVGLTKNETVYIYVGGQNNTFNGGGAGGSVWHSASNSEGSFSRNVTSSHGCGATDVRVGTELESRLIVAGGGGGNGHSGGVNYSYNGFDVSGGEFYNNIYAVNEVSSNDVLGQGSSYNTWVTSGDWGSGSYPNHGTYSYRQVTGGGGGGYYGGNSGYAGTSKVFSNVWYQEKEYQVTNSVVENLVYNGNGKCQISLHSLEADVITYYNYNMTKMGEAAGLTGTYVNFPVMSEAPTRASDSKYDYSYLGWDDMATEEIEHYTDAETVAAALNGDRNYIAAYESIGKSYTVSLDSADAQSPGTTSLMATYHGVLPDIIIPVKQDAVFAGYYTEQNGAGEQIYSAAGKGTALSEFDENSVIYAHWEQPIASIKNPENKEVLAGYAGVILTTEAELSQPTGYALTYQWYMNHENSNINGSPIEAADSRKLVIPQGFQPGNYYFYCLITATNVMNGQSVSAFTEPAQLSVEKGSIGMEYVEVETSECIYDNEPKTLRAAINNSNPYTIYYGTEPLNAENYEIKGTTVPNSYTDAGTYTNYIYVTGTDFTDFSGSISMTIQKAEPHVYLSSKNTAYNGQNQVIDAARVYGVDEKKMPMLTAYVYFMDEACTKKTDSSCGAVEEGGAPLAVGTYYVHAVTEETANYKAVATKSPAMFNILGTNVKYSISGFHGMYDGKPHGLQIVNEDEANAAIYFSDRVELTRDNYQTEGTTIPYEYTEVGRYPIYYIVVTKLAGGINQYEMGMAEIVIEAVKQNGGNNDSGNNGNSSNGGSSGNEDAGDGNYGGNSSGNGTQGGTVKPHVHNYELISFNQPTATEEGKALYRCADCGHELVITYPAQGKGTEDESTLAGDEAEELMPEGDKEAEAEQDAMKRPEPNKDKGNKIKENKEVVDKLSDTLQDEERKVYTEAEFERLLSMLRTQMMIQEEQVSLSENLPSVEEDTNEEQQETTKQTELMWNWLWAFLLGAAVMFLVRKIMETKKEKKQQKTLAPTRKLK